MDLSFVQDDVAHRHSYTGEIKGRFIDMSHMIVDNCDCDLHVKLVEVESLYVIRRYNGSVRRSITDMYYAACVMITTEWGMENRKLIPKNKMLCPEERRRRIADLRGDNMSAISPYFITNRNVKSKSIRIEIFPANLYRAFDLYYLSKIVNEDISASYLIENVWMQMRHRRRSNGEMVVACFPNQKFSGHAWEIHDVPSLKNMCLRHLSIFNKAYGGTPEGVPNIAYSMDRVEEKLEVSIGKLKKPTHSFFGRGQVFGDLHSTILTTMVKLLKVEDFKQTKVWNFENELAKSDDMSLDTSAGLRPEKKREYEIEGIKYNVICVGKKDSQMEYANNAIRKMAADIREGKDPILVDRAWSTVAKNEVLCGRTRAEILKLNDKLRLFQIPTVVLSKSQRMIHGFRQKRERGNHIAIGISHWYGGANIIAKKMHWKSGRHIYCTLDFVGLDTTIKAAFLNVYSYFTMYYYVPGTPDYDIFIKLLKVVADNLALKVAHVYKDVWKLIYGGMPSGAYETSHGDSWIVMYIIIAYCLNVAKNNPGRYNQIYNALITEDMFFYVFGDDTSWAIPLEINDLINIKGLCKFVKVNLQMETRDVVESTRFLSTIEHATGELKDEGVVFLSKYFVARSEVTDRTDVAEILPFRPLTKTIKKYAFGDGSFRTPMDRIIAAIGMAYDSFGTNRVAYEFCYFMYVSNMEHIGEYDFDSVLEKYSEDFVGKNVNGLLRKCNIEIEDLKKGFPSIEKLMDMHVYDKDKHRFDRGEIEATDILLPVFD